MGWGWWWMRKKPHWSWIALHQLLFQKRSKEWCRLLGGGRRESIGGFISGQFWAMPSAMTLAWMAELLLLLALLPSSPFNMVGICFRWNKMINHQKCNQCQMLFLWSVLLKMHDYFESTLWAGFKSFDKFA